MPAGVVMVLFMCICGWCFWMDGKIAVAHECAEVAHGHRDEHVAVIFSVDDRRVFVFAYAEILVGIAARLADSRIEIEPSASMALALEVPRRQAGNDNVRRTDPPRSLRDLRSPPCRKPFSGQSLGDFAFKRGAFLSGINHSLIASHSALSGA